jgi:hypothetical protein
MGKFVALLGVLWAWLLGLRIGVAGLWLLFLYALFGSFVVLSFSAFQLQLAINSYSAGHAAPLALWEVSNLYSRWKVDADQLDAVARRYRAISESIRHTEAMNEELRKNLNTTYSDCRAEILYFVTAVEGKIEKIDGEYANILKHEIEHSNFCKRDYGDRFFENYQTIIAAKQQIRIAASQPIGTEPARLSPDIGEILAAGNIKALNAIIYAKVAQATDIYRTIVYSTAQIEQWRRDQKDTLAELQTLNGSLARVLRTDDGRTLDSGIGDYLITLSYFDTVEKLPVLGDLVPNFTKMPSDTLTLILVLAMGALGGTIQLSRKHLRAMDETTEDTIQPSYYLFRPFLGSITALSVFILVKAGVLVASIPSPGGETANLSPFFISFLGIVSGLLAEQALETIERVGERFFTRSEADAPERWAYGLEAAMKSDDETTATYDSNRKALASALQVNEDQVTKWAREEEPVPQDSQKLIAAYFHLSMRQLFSDLRA